MVILVVSWSMESGEDMEGRVQEREGCQVGPGAPTPEGLLSTVSVRMEKPNTVQAGRRQGS